MIKDIRIENYCGITDLKINDCKRINLLVGKNGVGKTTILDFICYQVFGEYKRTEEFNNYGYVSRKCYFRIKDQNGKIKIAANHLGEGQEIILFDEVENGLHYSVMQDFWLNVIESSIKNKVQVFATTHSCKMIEALVEAAKEYDFIEKDEIRLFKIVKRGNETLVGSYNAEEIEAKVESGLEIT
jgi:AAA15 family ATPase/GTPase